VLRLPAKATVHLIHNGNRVLTTETDSLDYAVKQPGLYRVECWRGNRGWIFSNHIRIGMPI
ncbi:MAG: histidinol-phosphatase, partial [Candidatus Zixiibacteriota bacterium]